MVHGMKYKYICICFLFIAAAMTCARDLHRWTKIGRNKTKILLHPQSDNQRDGILLKHTYEPIAGVRLERFINNYFPEAKPKATQTYDLQDFVDINRTEINLYQESLIKHDGPKESPSIIGVGIATSTQSLFGPR